MADGKVVEISLISKISMRTIKTTPAKAATEDGTPIAVVYGMAFGIKEVVDKQRGDVYHALVGQFEAQNLQTADVFQSGQLYLPTGIHESLESAVQRLENESDYVQFALQILAIKASNPAGYSYQAKNLLASKQVDPLEEIRALIGGSVKTPLLESPAKKADARRKKK
jgi:hypothetical protein